MFAIRWKKELSEDPTHTFPGQCHLKPEEEKFRRLQRKLEDVKGGRVYWENYHTREEATFGR